MSSIKATHVPSERLENSLKKCLERAGKARELRFTTKDRRRSTFGELDSTFCIDNDFEPI